MSSETKRSHSYRADKHGVVSCRNCGSPPKSTTSCHNSPQPRRIINYRVFNNSVQQPLLAPSIGMLNVSKHSVN